MPISPGSHHQLGYGPARLAGTPHKGKSPSPLPTAAWVFLRVKFFFFYCYTFYFFNKRDS